MRKLIFEAALENASRRHSASLRLRQRSHPAYIPREVAGNPR